MNTPDLQSPIITRPGPHPASHNHASKRRRLLALLLAPCLAGLALAVLLGLARSVSAAGVVGTGTPQSCTYDALIAAMQGAGLVTFNCGALPRTIVVTFTGAVQPLGGQHTTLDGGGLITLSGNNTQRLFHVFPNTHFTLTHITLAHGYSSGAPGGALYNRAAWCSTTWSSIAPTPRPPPGAAAPSTTTKTPC